MVQKEVVIITGCSGRIGNAVIQKFADPKFQLIGFDIIPPPVAAPNLEYMKVDLTSDESVNGAMQQIRQKYGNRISTVVHLAAYYNFIGGAWEKYEQLTIQGTSRILNAVKKFECEQFIFSSTMLVHAPCKIGEKINEDAPLIMNWEYPKSKVLTEQLLHKEHGSIPVVILRIAGCYDDGCHSIPISNQIQRIYERQFESKVFPGDLCAGAPFLHLDDMGDVVAVCFEKRKQLPNELTVLIGEEEALSYNQLQREISKLLFGKEMTTIRIPKWVAKIGAKSQNCLPFMKKTFIKPWMIDIADSNYALDLSRTKQYLGWAPKRSLRMTLPIMIGLLKQDPQKWYKENLLS